MTATLADPVSLHPVEVDLLCALAEVSAPFPLDIPSTGRTHGQRKEMFGVARQQLANRGLAGKRGPEGTAATFVRMLRAAGGTVDLVVAEHGRNRGAVALVEGQQALLITQSPDDPERVVRMAEVNTDTAVRELLNQVPNMVPGDIPPFTVPLPPVQRVFDRLDTHRRTALDSGREPNALSDTDVDGLLWESGVDDRTVSRLTTALRQPTGSGQIGAARWLALPGRWERLGDETHWVDTGHGRFKVSQSADGHWASVNPFSRNDIRADLRTLAATVRGDGDEEDVWE